MQNTIIEEFGLKLADMMTMACCLFWFHQPEEPAGMKKLRDKKKEERK